MPIYTCICTRFQAPNTNKHPSGVWSRGVSRYAEGWKGFLFENNEFWSVLVSWFLRVLVSSCLRFKVSKLQSCKDSKLFHVFDRYWSNITKIAFRAFWKILIPSSRFSENIRRNFGIFSGPIVSKCFKMSDSQKCEISQTKICEMIQKICPLIEVSWCLQRQIIMVLGVMDASTKSEKT